MTRSWCEYNTPYFTVYSDLRERTALRIAGEMLKFHHATSEFLKPIAREGTSTKIVLFRSPKEFAREVGQSKFVGIMQPSFLEHKLILAVNARERDRMQLPFHEYSHYIIRTRLERPAPRWLEEGLAQYLSTMKISGDSKATVGELHRKKVLVSFLESKHRDWNELLHFDVMHSEADDLVVQYEVAWALVHFLIHSSTSESTHPFERINALIEQTNQGRDSIESYMEIAQTSEAKLDSELYEYLLSDQDLIDFEFDYSEATVEVNDCLDTADKHLLLADAIADFNSERAQYILVRLLRKYSDDHRVHAALSRVTRENTEESLAHAEQAHQMSPDSAETSIVLASALIRSCLESQGESCNELLQEAQSLFEKAMAIDEGRVDAAFGLGILLNNSGKAEEAIEYLQLAHEYAPWSARVHFHLGETYRQLGRYEEAIDHLTIAANWETDLKRKEGIQQVLTLVESMLVAN